MEASQPPQVFCAQSWRTRKSAEGARCRHARKSTTVSRIAPNFGKWTLRDRLALVDCLKLCLGCLTSDHSRAAKACPFKEERVDACKRIACKASHDHLLNIYRSQGKLNQEKRPDSLEGSPTEKPREALRASHQQQKALQCSS
jgi:hypothetical protein